MSAADINMRTLTPKGFTVPVGSLLLTTLAINILSLALPVMTLQVYDRVLPAPGTGTIAVLATGVCVAIVLEAILRLTRAYIMGWAGASYEHRMSCAAMNHILSADISRLGAYGVGEYLHRMTAIGKLKNFHDGYALMTYAELAFVPIFMGLVIYIAGPLAFVPAAILMAFTIISLACGYRLRGALEKRDQADDQRYNFLIETLEGIHTIKSFALENAFSRRYEALEEKSTSSNYRVTEATSGAFNAGTVFSSLMVACVITLGAVLVLKGQITTGALIATVLLSGRMMQPVQRALGLWTKYQDYALSREKVETLFDVPLHAFTPGDYEAHSRQGTLSLENVSFRHGDDGAWILKDISLDLKAGECVFLTAGHGAGKTALLELVSGIYPAGTGNIMLDGQNILRYPPEKLIRHVGYIKTEGLIFRGTIRDNMTCFGLTPENEVREVAALLNVDRDIAKLPAGFDTFLNGNGTDSIPPGLKQRIAMVRVLAAKPRLILFDSADRALDRQGYELVYRLLARLKGRATMIVTSDDQNLRALADRFIMLENGKLKEQDSKNNKTPQQEMNA